jgi:hypothetical protein
MRALPAITCLWPGLPRLWWRGEWVALVSAVVFGAALNLVLVSSFIWPELLPAGWAILGWLTVAAVWCCCVIRSYRSLSTLHDATPVVDRGLFIEAQREYLRGHWPETESLLQRLTRCSPGDVDAQLMLATLYRRRGRIDEAQARLQVVERLDGAQRWQWEISHERWLLNRAEESARHGGGTGPPA